MKPFVNLIIISASGFSVKEHHDSGVRTMHQQFRLDYQSVFPQAEIIYRAWNAPWKSLARRLHQVALTHCPTIFVGHSWGCGHAYRKFEKEWHRCARVIDRAFLIDPVPRPFGFLPLRLANVFAVFGRGSFRVAHARYVTTWRQVNSLPVGRPVTVPNAHTLVAYAMGTRKNINRYGISDPAIGITFDPLVTHSTIDDRPSVQKLIQKEINAYVETILET